MEVSTPPFNLLELNTDVAGEICSFLPSECICRLYATGSIKILHILTYPNVVKLIRCDRAPKSNKEIKLTQLLKRFPTLHALTILDPVRTKENHNPRSCYALAYLPSTIRSLTIKSRNCHLLLSTSPLTTQSDNPICDISQILPHLGRLTLFDLRPLSELLSLSRVRWPTTLWSLSLPNAIVTCTDIANLPVHIEDLEVGIIVPPPTSESWSPLSSSLKSVREASHRFILPGLRNKFAGQTLFDNLDILPPGLTILCSATGSFLEPHGRVQFPRNLIKLSVPKVNLEVPAFSNLTKLEKLAMSGAALQANFSQFLPRSLIKLSISGYKWADDDFWMGLPPNIQKLELGENYGSIHKTPLCYLPGRSNQSIVALTRSCLPYLPKKVTQLNLQAIELPLDSDDTGLLSTHVRALKINAATTNGILSLPREIQFLSVLNATLTREWTQGLPPKLKEFHIDLANILEPSSLAISQATQLSEISIKTDHFNHVMASHLPKILKSLQIICQSAIGDEIMAALDTPDLTKLELRSPLGAFTDTVIPLLPRNLTQLKLCNCDAWTLSQASLQSLPQQLLSIHVGFEDPDHYPLKPASEFRCYLPKSLAKDNFPSLETVNKFY